MNIKLYDTGQGATVSALNSEQLFNLINQQYNGFSGSQDQHNFIYNFMLPTMVKVLSEIKNALVSVEDDISMKTLTIRSIAPYQKVGFNWNDFFLQFIFKWASKLCVFSE